MPLINKLLKVFPKKQIDIKEIEKPVVAPKLSQVETYIKTNTPNETKEQEASNFNEMNLGNEPEYEIVEREILPEKIVCPDCGGITLEGLEYCDKCGGELGSY
ncbi:hypothetical protein [Clostridium sp. Marseille-P299]|uniref:hypothetical protein n=1 Tax=Clostridium sp. Marseille-P299 TaxID=1805477 RepID=UPI00082F434D|nr:hypothetical protein [Clostridium sp. Marseille-P299]